MCRAPTRSRKWSQEEASSDSSPDPNPDQVLSHPYLCPAPVETPAAVQVSSGGLAASWLPASPSPHTCKAWGGEVGLLARRSVLQPILGGGVAGGSVHLVTQSTRHDKQEAPW